MPQIIPCPECANRIRITDELIGKRIRCPRCNNTFDAMRPSESSPVTTVADPIPEPPSPRPLPRDLPRPPKQEPTLESGAAETGTWEIVLTGVNFQVAGHLLAMGGGLLIFVSFFLIIVG